MGHQPTGQNLGRPPVLDETKRKTIIALLANGSSRRMAAGYVGCAPSTITRTAARDPEFAAQLARTSRRRCRFRPRTPSRPSPHQAGLLQQPPPWR